MITLTNVHKAFGPNRVLQCKSVETDGYKAVQLGFEDKPVRRRERLDHAVDTLRERFGEASVARARGAPRARGLRDSR